jgi:PTH1 family peptidyl-tRNA hydrolase
MFLLVGLGNPGARHAGDRHNIGFMVVDAIAKRHGFAPWRRRFQGVATEGTLGGTKTLLLLPGTFMNESGRAVGEAANFYKIGLDEIAVVHDELDLAPGKLRIKRGGGVAGHNGLRSITAHIGNDYKRVRIGIGHPGDKNIVHSYVLSDFSKAERTGWVETLIEAVAEHAPLLARGEDASLQNKVHLALDAKGFDDGKSGDQA